MSLMDYHADETEDVCGDSGTESSAARSRHRPRQRWAAVPAARPVHSLHVRFVGTVHPAEPLHLRVARIKEGRAFDLRARRRSASVAGLS
ncbi:acyl-CoA thioesterase domain-containing protein [Micromonospora fulviviridis]|uniref:acyl-CoA thioesterase domain-containing protein n=1 Tax=Micromonospora fulviviridis TaxID=47860 RepID=UPI0037A895AB